jgi:hypothetical protein
VRQPLWPSSRIVYGEVSSAFPLLKQRRGSNYSILMFLDLIQAHAAYLNGAGPFFDFTCDEFLQIRAAVPQAL